MSKFLRLAGVLGGTLLVLNLAVVALAQPRDAGWKMRGDYSRPSSSSGYRSFGGYPYYAPTPSEAYRSFSYEPIGIQPGDSVVVTGNNIKMMKGANIVGAVPNGLKFKVTQVVDGWLGAIVEVEGQELSGWIWHENVSLAEDAAGALPQAARDNTQSIVQITQVKLGNLVAA